MNENTFAIYNTLINEYIKCANQYHAMKLDFYHAGLKGFYCFCKNESMERWKFSDKISKHVLKRDKKPIIEAMPKPTESFSNPIDAITAAYGMEAKLISLFQTNIAQIEPLEQPKMSKYYSYAMKEYNEISHVKKKMEMPGSSVFDMDMYLKSKYNPCGYKK